MLRLLLHPVLALAAAILVSSWEASDGATPPVGPPSVPLEFLPALKGDYFRLDSQQLGRSVHIYVRLPEDYRAKPELKYPAVYLLDGDSLFPILAASHLFLTYDEHLPEAIIVGIAYGSFDPAINKRDYDFSAPAADATTAQGGAPKFEEMLRRELLPIIERRYRTNPDRRILFGQSRGGYMVLWSAFTDPDLFWGRIASNPSLDPGHERFFAQPAAATRHDLGLVVTSGERDHPASRERALQWFEAWNHRQSRSWSLKTATLEGGTHAADCLASYRFGMLWLFSREGSPEDGGGSARRAAPN